MKYDLNVEAEELRIWGVNMNVMIKERHPRRPFCHISGRHSYVDCFA